MVRLTDNTAVGDTLSTRIDAEALVIKLQSEGEKLDLVVDGELDVATRD